MKKILFPTDFSPAANHAFIYALHLADVLSAEITTLHAYPLPEIHGVVMPNLVGEIEQSIRMEEFDEYRNSVDQLRVIAEANSLGHVRVNHTLKTGSTIKAILASAESEGSDVIIMGTKGATGLREVFVGSVTGEIMEKANCPVLAIPDEASFDHNIDRLVVTTDFTDEDEKALIEVLKFASLFDKTQVVCLHVSPEVDEEKKMRFENMKVKFRDHHNLHFEILSHSEIFRTLGEYLEKERIDIVTMLTHKRNFFKELFKYSRAKRMIYHSKIPVLAIPAHLLK
ncbi:MAG: universal stress protein [Saprospiraceae bacterium]|nr:universal stress protein [Saprospiraceae bacterium]